MGRGIQRTMYQLSSNALLKDGVHLNDHGNFVMSALVEHWLVQNATGDDHAWTNLVRTFQLGKELHPAGEVLRFEFFGNRIDAISSPLLNRSEPLEVWIDGRKPSSIPSLRSVNRVSAFPNSNWPCLLKVDAEAPRELEEWTVTLTDVSDDLKNVKFTIKGSTTGDDGAGSSTERFVSKSKRVVIEPGDWNLEYCHRVFKKTVPVGFTFNWNVVPNYKDEFQPSTPVDSTLENCIVLAQGLTNAKHVVELRGKSFENLSALRIYRPPLASKPD
ncbi:MAG: hypothetical protein JWN25_534 [Verrucomicrobiales bacterium]|nr:hypothetical protein [Verrucomicrobiales bacterium]